MNIAKMGLSKPYLGTLKMHSVPGRTAGRYLKALAVSRGDELAVAEFIDRSGWGDSHVLKAAVSASHSGNASAFLQQVGRDYMDLVRSLSVVGRLSGFRKIPFGTRVVRQTDGPAASWIAEHGTIPVVRATYAKDNPLPARKVGAVAVETLELARASDSEMMIVRDLAKANAEAIDLAFFDPDNAGDTDMPASVTKDQQSVVGGSTAPAADLAEAVEALVSGGGDFNAATWVMRPELYANFLLTRVANENGTLAGRPVLTTSVLPLATAGSAIVLIDPTGIELAGGVDAKLDVSLHGDVAMSDDPTSEPSRTGLFQTESFGMKAVTAINWRAAAGRVVYISGALY